VLFPCIVSQYIDGSQGHRKKEEQRFLNGDKFSFCEGELFRDIDCFNVA
jgi:hypothetical protein